MHAEFVALAVGHHHPILAALFADAKRGRPAVAQTLNLRINTDAPLLERRGERGAAYVHIQVHAILDCLGLGHALEEQPRTRAIGVDDSAA